MYMARKLSAVRVAGLAILAWVLFGCSGGGALDVGATPPDFTVTSPDSAATKVSSAGLQGKVVLIDFWATWCGPCREALPHIASVWKQYKDKGLQVLAVSSEDATTVSSFQSKEGIDVPMFLDPGQKMADAFGVTGFPTTLLIGKNGKVVYSVVGTGPGVEPEMDKAIAQALL